MTILFDIALAAALIGLAFHIARTSEDQGAIVSFVAFGLHLSLGWARLSSIDVAMTEAAIGSGVTGLLMLRAEAFLRADKPAASAYGFPAKLAVGILCAGLAGALAYIVVAPPQPQRTLANLAMASLDTTGLGNPVTAVLMAFRAFDTLLEKVVLILALIGVWSLAPNSFWGGAPAPAPIGAPEPLVFLARTLSPIGVLVGVYLLWAGADEPGGAFQGGAVMAAMWLLVMFAGLRGIPQTNDVRLRRLLVGGPIVFLAIGLLGIGAGAFLAYPEAIAKPLIVIIEVALILSIAATLGMLVMGPSKKAPGE